MRAALAEMSQQAGRVIGERLRLRHRLTEHEVPFMKQRAQGRVDGCAHRGDAVDRGSESPRSGCELRNLILRPCVRRHVGRLEVDNRRSPGEIACFDHFMDVGLIAQVADHDDVGGPYGSFVAAPELAHLCRVTRSDEMIHHA